MTDGEHTGNAIILSLVVVDFQASEYKITKKNMKAASLMVRFWKNNWRKPTIFYLKVFLQVPKCFVPVQIFWTRKKNEIVFSTAPSSFVLTPEVNLLKGNHLLVSHKKFGTGTKYVN